jgi:predicted RNA-binding Zn ribbon-like protein
MSAVPAADPALSLAIAFLNTWDLLEPDPERMTPARLERLARADGFDRLAERLAAATPADLDRLRAVRDGLYPVFAAPAAAEKIDQLNAALARADVRPRLARDENAMVRLAVTRTDPAMDLASDLAALVLDALAHAMATGGPDRFGTCVGEPCRCVYVDRTRAARQRFCCQLCNDRVAAAAYRSRRAANAT